MGFNVNFTTWMQTIPFLLDNGSTSLRQVTCTRQLDFIFIIKYTYHLRACKNAAENG